MQHFSISPKEMIASLWRNRSLIKALARREVVGRYRGSVTPVIEQAREVPECASVRLDNARDRLC